MMKHSSFYKNSSRILAMILAAAMVVSLGADIMSVTNVYAAESTEYTCGMEEHTHDDSCYTTEQNLTCKEEPHTHSEENGCYDEDGNLTCDQAEHEHEDSCYTSEEKLTCDQAEHTHDDACTSDASNDATPTPAKAPKAPTANDGNEDDGDVDPQTDNSNSASINFYDNVTSAKMQKLVGNKWTDTKTFDDGDQVKISLEYAFDDTNKITSGTNIYYQLPDGCVPQDNLSGKVTGYINNQYYSDLGDYTIDKDGKITIVFNETFHNTSGAFTGTVEFQGTASNDSTENNKDFSFYAGGETYRINKKQLDNDLKITKTGSKKASDTVAEYTVVVNSENGTGTDPVKIVDTVYPSGLNMDQVKYQNIKVTNKDGNVVSVGSNQIEYESGDNYKKLTIKDLAALGAGERYTITYEIDYGATIGNGDATLNNNVHGYKGNEDKGNAGQYLVVAKKLIDKTANATDNNSAILWTITVNPNHSTNVAGEYSLSDELNNTGIDWSEVEDFSVIKSNGNWDSHDDVTNSVGADVKAGKITIEDGYSYTITYKTKVEGAAGEKVTQKNSTTITKDGKSWTGEAEGTVTKPAWNVGKTGTGVTEDKDAETATAGWKSSVTLPLQSDGTTGYGENGLLFKDTIQTKDGTRDSGVHYATPGTLGLVVKLDGAELSSSEYTITYYNANNQVISNPSDTDKITYFEVKVNGPKTGVTMTFEYNTKMVIGSLKDGESLTVKNTSKVEGKTSDATQTYTKPNKLVKQSSGTAFENNLKNTSSSKTTLQYTEINGKIYYRLIVYPTDIKGGVLTDVIPDGLSLDAKDVTVYISDGYNLVTLVDGVDISLDRFKPTVSVDGQTLTVTFKDFRNVSNIYGGMVASDFWKSGGCYVIDYSVTIEDDTFWNNLDNNDKTYSNSATWNGKTTTQDTEIKRTLKDAEKNGEQLTDESGNPTNRIRYYVTINPKAATLYEGRTLTLSDTIKTGDNGITAELDLNSVKLYHYDYTNKTGHFLGAQMSQNDYTFVYDKAARTFTAGIPDKTACVLVYDYVVDNWNSVQSDTFKNTVTLKGKETVTDSKETSVKQASSSATVLKKNTFKLIKVDSERYQVTLPEAQFELYRYDVTQKTWTQNDLSKHTLTSDKNGELNFATSEATSTAEGTTILATNTLYKLVETKAPSGYSLPSEYTPYYFVMLDGSTASKDTFWSKVLGSSVTDTQATKTITNADITYVMHDTAETIYAPNRFSSITVDKKWVDWNGDPLTKNLPKSLKVTLYEQSTKLDAVTVTMKLVNGSGVQADTVSYQVKPNSTFEIFNLSGDGKGADITVDGVKHHVTGTVYSGDTSPATYSWTVTKDTEVTVYELWAEANEGNNNNYWLSAVISFTYTQPSDYIASGTATKSSRKDATVDLATTGDWSFTWTDLAVKAADGTPIYYTVQEVDEYGVSTIPEGYTQQEVTNNGGIQTGVISITNKKIRTYELPKTGGEGTVPYTVGGLTAIVLSMLSGAYLMRRRYMN